MRTRGLGTPSSHLPVGQSHAFEQFGQRGVYGDLGHAGFSEMIRLTRLFVYSVEVVALLGWVLAVGRRHHEVSAVDDLGLDPICPPQNQVGLLNVGVVFVLLFYDRRRTTVLLPRRHHS